MKIGTTVLGATMLALASLGASAADNVSYSYIDLNYVNTDLERGPSGDGFGVRGSVGFAGNFFVFADSPPWTSTRLTRTSTRSAWVATWKCPR